MNNKIITFFYIYRLNSEFQKLKVLILHNFIYLIVMIKLLVNRIFSLIISFIILF